MKSQKQNQGELKELKVRIEKDVVESVERMAKNGGMSIDDLVNIAIKRYRSAHSDLDGKRKEIKNG